MPISKDWTTVANVAEEFSDEDNIGVRLGNGLVDIDLDCSEATVVAKLLLPSNTLIHGRKGKPFSHYWFVTDTKEDLYTKFNDLDGASLLELRGSTRHQTVLPPSVHASGDVLTWHTEHAPLMMDPKDLVKIVRAVAVATLLSRHWPSGSRHATAGHLAGLLHRLGYSALEIPRIVRATAVAARDEEPGDRERAARDTCEKLSKGDARITGAPSLAKVFGTEIVSRIYTWFDKDDDNAVDKINTTHFAVQIGDKMVVGNEFEDGPTIFMSYPSFVQRYYNKTVGKQKLGEFWLQHPQRREFRKVVFAPPPMWCHPNDYNLWRGFTVDPLPDDESLDDTPIQRFLNHIFEVICSGNSGHLDYVLDLLAVTVQLPGRPTGKVLAMRGHQGAGKSMFMSAYGGLFGRHYCVVSDRRHVVGNFNSHLSGKVVVLADEALWGGSKKDTGPWKRLVTEQTVMIERKGLDATEEPNCIHLFMASNEENMGPAGERERRMVVLDTSPIQRTKKYFDDFAAEVAGPKFKQTLLTYFLRRQPDEARWKGMLITKGLRELQEFSGGPVQQWWAMKLADGFLIPGKPWPDALVLHDLYTDYLEEMGDLGRQRDLGTRAMFGRHLKRFLPPATQYTSRMVKRMVRGQYLSDMRVQMRVALIPDLTQCRRFFDSVLNTTEEWLTPDGADPTLPADAEPELPEAY